MSDLLSVSGDRAHRIADTAALQRGRVARCQLLQAGIRTHEQLPMTSPARTLLDIAEDLSPTQLEWALDEALVVLRIVRPAEIADVVDRLRSRPGAVRLRRLLRARQETGATRREAERRFLTLIRKAGLPEPERNVTIHGYQVDFLWRAAGVVVEIDGYRFHSSRSAFERDRRKDGALKAAGFDVTRITWRQLTEEPLLMIARLAARLARSAAA